ALTRLHAQAAHPWTLEELAREVGLSRSSLADRFLHLVGHPPMQYLAQWRMQVAAGLLTNGGTSLAEIAAQVGYASEAAFSRAFKKIVGEPPAAWRRQKSNAASAAVDSARPPGALPRPAPSGPRSGPDREKPAPT